MNEIIFSHSTIKHIYERLRAFRGSHMKGCSYPAMDINCVPSMQGWCVNLEEEGVCYNCRDASSAANVLGPPPSRGGDLELEGGFKVSL